MTDTLNLIADAEQTSPSKTFDDLFDAPAEPAPAPAGKVKAARKPKAARSSKKNELGYTPLPEKKTTALTPRQQRAFDRAEEAKEKAADIAAQRINGAEFGQETTKKPWLTIVSGKKAKPDMIAETLTDLASTLESGEPEYTSVRAVADQYEKFDIGEGFDRVARLMSKGRGVTLTAALADQEDNFPPVVRELIGAANTASDLHRNLRQAAVIIVEADNIKAQIRSALFEPALMASIMAAFTIFAVEFGLPIVQQNFAGFGGEVPVITLIAMAVGGFVKWILIGAIVLLLITAAAWPIVMKKSDRARRAVDRLAMRVKYLGDIQRMAVAARLCDVLAAGLKVGLSELSALETAARACGNRAVQHWIEEHLERQRYGVVDFADFADTDLVPWNLRMRLGNTNSIPRRIEIFQELAVTFHHKANERLERFAERIAPISKLVTFTGIGVVLMIIISPLLTLIPTMIGVMS